MHIGIAFDLKEDFKIPEGREDLLEEYDSIDTIQAIRGELERLGHKVSLLHGGRRFLDNILGLSVELVFNIAEGSGGRSREAHIPALCEMLRIPFTHSDALALSLSLDKSLAIQVAKSAGLPTPFQHIIRTRQEVKALRPPLPVVLKPLHEGSSMGIRNDCLVKSHEALQDGAIRLLETYDQPVIVEEFLPGKELTVGILGNNPPQIIGVMEIAPAQGPTENFLYSIETKRDYRRLVSYACPPTGLPGSMIVETGRIALKTYELFGCCDVARVDLRLDGKGNPRLLEINPLPGLSPVYSDLCIMASLVGLPYGELIEGILDAALERLGLHDGKRKKSKKKRQALASSHHPEFRRLQ